MEGRKKGGGFSRKLSLRTQSGPQGRSEHSSQEEVSRSFRRYPRKATLSQEFVFPESQQLEGTNLEPEEDPPNFPEQEVEELQEADSLNNSDRVDLSGSECDSEISDYCSGDEEEEEEVYLADVIQRLSSLRRKYSFSDQCAQDLWVLLVNFSWVIERSLKRGELAKKSDFRYMNFKLNRDYFKPPESITKVNFFQGENPEPKEEVHSVLPNKFNGSEFDINYIKTSVSLPDVVKFHKDLHGMDPETTLTGQLSTDGVEMSVNSGYKLNLTNVQFEGCPTVYQVIAMMTRKKIRCAKAVKPTVEDEYKDLIDETKRLQSSLQISKVTADSKCRPILLGTIFDGGYYSCHLCDIPGERVENKVVYPPNLNWELVSPEQFRELGEAASLVGEENAKRLDKRHIYQGVINRTPFHEVPGLILPQNVIPDMFHVVYEGVVSAFYS